MGDVVNKHMSSNLVRCRVVVRGRDYIPHPLLQNYYSLHVQMILEELFERERFATSSEVPESIQQLEPIDQELL
jgi:hypothetical protein